MSKLELTTPILIEIDEICYKLIYISFADDGSIYIFFPRKRGYIVSKEKDLPDKIINKMTVSLDRFPDKIFSPYISYHPKLKSVHVNTQNREMYKLDAKVINMAENKGILTFPLCQILFPRFSYLDVYSSKKYTHPFIIKSKTAYPETCLNVEVFIHPIGTYSDWENLPLNKVRRENSNPVGLARFSSKKLRSHTCTLAITEAKTKYEILDNVIPGIIVAMFNERQPYIFELTPNG